MSLRSYRDQIAVEEEAERKFREDLGPAAEHFDDMTKEEVRDAVACPLHVVGIGTFCGAARRGVTWNCIGRRKAAARLRAGLA